MPFITRTLPSEQVVVAHSGLKGGRFGETSTSVEPRLPLLGRSEETAREEELAQARRGKRARTGVSAATKDFRPSLSSSDPSRRAIVGVDFNALFAAEVGRLELEQVFTYMRKGLGCLYENVARMDIYTQNAEDRIRRIMDEVVVGGIAAEGDTKKTLQLLVKEKLISADLRRQLEELQSRPTDPTHGDLTSAAMDMIREVKRKSAADIARIREEAAEDTARIKAEAAVELERIKSSFAVELEAARSLTKERAYDMVYDSPSFVEKVGSNYNDGIEAAVRVLKDMGKLPADFDPEEIVAQLFPAE